GEWALKEVADIAYAATRVSERIRNPRVVVLGRGSAEAQPLLQEALGRAGLQLLVLGLLPAQEVARHLLDADVLLFVRGSMTSGRGTVLAGVGCGLAVVGYGDAKTSYSMSKVAVLVVPRENHETLASALELSLA